MNNDISGIKQAAAGRWPEVLSNVGGIRPELLDGRHHPCPMCGGKDRFRLIDAEAGAVLCNQCFREKNGDGLAAIQWMQGWDFPAAAGAVAKYLGLNGSNVGGAQLSGKPQIVATYEYRDENKQLNRQVCRTEPKGFFQRVLKEGGGWLNSTKGVPEIPYQLPELLEADPSLPVWIPEGEKDVDRLVGLRCIATCNAGGAGKWRPEFASYVAGRWVVILADADEAGRKHAQQVAASLHGVAASVKVIELPGMPDKSDVSDWLNAGHTLDELWAFALAASAWEPSEKPKKVNDTPRWRPFPISALPKLVGRYVRAASGSIGCDPAFVALPQLSTLAGAVGNSTRIALKSGWQEPAVVWTGIVGDSGTHKSPALRSATRFADERDAQEIRAFEEQRASYESKYTEYEVDLKAWQRKPNGLPPMEPTPPVCRRFLVSDVTIEALAERLADSPRGLSMVRDELAGWFSSFNQYKGGRGSDEAGWLSIHGASSLRVDRRTGDRKTIFVPSAAVSITGGIQPPVLARSLGVSHFENGLAARVLLAMPPKMPRKWNDQQISMRITDAMGQVFDRLWSLKPDEGDNGEQRPVDLPLTPEAMQVWITFYNAHGLELTALTGNLAAAWSKLEGYAARLALVCHLANWAAGSDPSPGPVDQAAVEAGIALVEWFKNETRRVYATFGESEGQGEQRKLVEWIDQRNGRVTVRQVQQGIRRFKTSEEAEAALQELVTAGVGNWEEVPTTENGGRPTRVFQASGASTVYKTPETPEEDAGSVDVDSVDVSNKAPESPGCSPPENQESLNDDWGEV